MKIENPLFKPEIVHSEFHFRNFLKGEEAIQRICQKAKTEKPYTPSHYYNGWKVALIIATSPIQFLVSLFFKAMAALLHCIGARSLAIRSALLGKHCLYHIDNLNSQWAYGKQFLCPTINTHNLNTSDVYLQPPVPVSAFKCGWVKDKIWEDKQQIDFYHPDGVCRGSTDWFLYLYQKTRGKFRSPHQHVKAVTEELRKGANREAAILHSFDSPKFFSYQKQYCLYQDKKEAASARKSLQEMNPSNEFLEDIPFIKTSDNRCFFLDTTLKICDFVKKLPPGVYGTNLLNHKIAYIKIDQDLGFIYNANEGAFSLEGKDSLEKAAAIFDKLMNDANYSVIVFDEIASDPQMEENRTEAV